MSAFAMTSIKDRYSAMVTSSKARSDLATLKCCIDGPQRWRRAPGVCSWLDPFRCRNVPGLGEPGPGEPAEGPASARAVSPCSFSVQFLRAVFGQDAYRRSLEIQRATASRSRIG